ncbi:MAG: hypothetical protein HY248_06100, partial [Fimbriimonas ginsengisoli]|nr:hypothetical protein [Fimbriimonas ginsengisoli]
MIASGTVFYGKTQREMSYRPGSSDPNVIAEVFRRGADKLRDYPSRGAEIVSLLSRHALLDER